MKQFAERGASEEIMQLERRSIAIALIIGSAFFFTLMATLARKAGSEIPSGEVAFFRVFISLILLTPYLIYKKISLLGKRWGLVLVRGIVGFIGLSLGFFALTKIPIAEVSVLWKSSIVFTAILSVLLLKEKVTAKLVAWILLSFIGAILILKPSTSVFNIGGLAALTAGFTVGIVSVSIRKLHQTEHSETIVYGFCFWGSVLGLILFGHTFIMPSLHQAMTLVAIGLCGLFGQTLFTRAFLYAPASAVQPFTFAEVLFTAISGAAIFGQIPDLLSILGGIAIIISGLGIFIQGANKDRERDRLLELDS